MQAKSVPLPLDGLVIQSIIAKWMGNLQEWTPHLERMSRRGYNMIHFTPLQQRGESNSPYSILDQLAFSDDLYEKKGIAKDVKEKKMKEALSKIKKDYGMLSMIDVVLNHTANNSPWLQDHPEAGEFRFVLHVARNLTRGTLKATMLSTRHTCSPPWSSTRRSSRFRRRSRLAAFLRC